MDPNHVILKLFNSFLNKLRLQNLVNFNYFQNNESYGLTGFPLYLRKCSIIFIIRYKLHLQRVCALNLDIFTAVYLILYRWSIHNFYIKAIISTIVSAQIKTAAGRPDISITRELKSTSDSCKN